jgi:hypothetical protein
MSDRFKIVWFMSDGAVQTTMHYLNSQLSAIAYASDRIRACDGNIHSAKIWDNMHTRWIDSIYLSWSYHRSKQD